MLASLTVVYFRTVFRCSSVIHKQGKFRNLQLQLNRTNTSMCMMLHDSRHWPKPLHMQAQLHQVALHQAKHGRHAQLEVVQKCLSTGAAGGRAGVCGQGGGRSAGQRGGRRPADRGETQAPAADPGQAPAGGGSTARYTCSDCQALLLLGLLLTA